MAETNQLSSILKDTREAKGLTLEIVHEATKIPLDVLKAIEQGYSVRILTPFYYRGFVKIYAEFLGLNAHEVLKSCNLEKSPSPVVAAATAPKPKRPATKPTGFAGKEEKKLPRVSVPNPMLERTQEILAGIVKPKNIKNILRFVGILVCLFVLVKVVGCVGSHIKIKPKSKVAVKVKEVKSEPSVTAESVVVAPVEIVKAQSTTRKVEVTARANKNTWIQVKADGKVSFAATMQKGTVESWTAKDSIEVSGKNINELEWEVNGKHLGSLSSSDRHVKRVLITKEGLSVKP